MNKILSLFSIALVLIAISFAYLSPVHSQPNNIFTNASKDCQVLNACAEEGDDCNITGKCTYNSSDNPDCCGSGLKCYNESCAYDNIGEWCNTAQDCFGTSTLTTACINNTCTQQGFPGDSCDYDTDCYYFSNPTYNGTTNDYSVKLGCNNSVCQGLAFNASCSTLNSNDYACLSSLYCNVTIGSQLGNCSYQIATNKPCRQQNDVCYNGFCNSTGFCSDFNTKGENDECTSTLDCEDAYVCLPNATGDFICQTPDSLNKTDCTENSNCTKGFECLCNTLTGDQYCVPINQVYLTYSDCGSDFSDLRECIATNNCSFYYAHLIGSSTTLNPNSCVAQNCESNYDDAASCGCDVEEDIYDSCIGNQQCSSFPLWAIIVIAIVGVILVLVVIVVIVMVMRKRRTTYDTIA